MTFDFREKMVEYMVDNGYGFHRPSEEEKESMRRYYATMSDEQIFDEFSSDVYKSGQDSMSY